MANAIVIDTTTANVKVHHAFGVKDAKGREIGAEIVTYNVVYRPFIEGEGRSYLVNTGGKIKVGFTYRVVQVQATRDGKSWGASQSSRQFDSEEAAAAYIAKYLDGAKKRAAKAASR